MTSLPNLAQDFAAAIMAADARRPVAVNQRTGEAFQPGIGPHSESRALALIAAEMQATQLARYAAMIFDVPYPGHSRQKCDLAIGEEGSRLFVECKLLRIFGDNGKPNDNMLMHILSPYLQHRSAVTDCAKLRESGFRGRKAILIFGYAGAGWPLEPAIAAFELIARREAKLGPRASAPFSGLCHPIHSAGEVFVWEIG